jgi:transposase
MKFIIGQDRQQAHLFPVSLEQSIDLDNEARVIDLFVDGLPLKSFGFGMDYIENGRPAYHPADLLKLFIYGYLNKIRSSRDLEKECKRNIEVMWLLRGLQPDYNTISNFRKDNPKAIKNVFRATVKIAKHFELIGGKLIAGDSTKLRAQNSKKNNFNQAKIERHLAYIDSKLEEYTHVLSQQDEDNKQQIQAEVEKQLNRKNNYKKIEEQLLQTGESQVSTSDPESRQMIIRNSITEVAYNVQTTVDAKHCIPFDYKVTNNNDSKAMGEMLTRAVEILGKNDFSALYDKGYHTGSELKIGQELGVETIVAIPEISSASYAPNADYNVSEFKYDAKEDTYMCPQGHTLATNGNWYKKNHHSKSVMVQHYKTRACKSCSMINFCTKNTRGRGRVIERSEYSRYVEQNRKNIEKYEHFYKRRQAIVEHPYGTIKRQWGFSYILTKKGKDRASADVGFMLTAYNLKRIINILGQDVLRKYLERLVLLFSAIMLNIKLIISHFNIPKSFMNLKLISVAKISNRIIFENNKYKNGGF